MVAMSTSLRTSKSAMSLWDSLTPKTYPDCTIGLTTGWMFVYTIQPAVQSVVKPVWQPVWQQVVSCTRGFKCNVSAISAFYRPTTQAPSIANCLSAIIHTKPVNSNFSPEIGCHGNLIQHRLTPSNTWFPSNPTTQTASRSVQLFLQGSLVWQTDRSTDRQTNRPTDRPHYSVGNNRPHLCT